MLRLSIRVSVLFNEPKLLKFSFPILASANQNRFSALQRAEIAEIERIGGRSREGMQVSVLFNEPKLLKSSETVKRSIEAQKFQCSSTSRNC